MVLLEGAVLVSAPRDNSGSLVSPASGGTCTPSLAFFQSVRKGVPIHPPPSSTAGPCLCSMPGLF